jgi:hypothetical protein
MIGSYPNLTEIELTDLPELAPRLRALTDGLSELTFAGLYCFRNGHGYRVGRVEDGTLVLSGTDKGQPFFLCPFGLPEQQLLDELFARFTTLKLATELQAQRLREAGHDVVEDRDNFDYLYHRADLATLAGRAYQKKRNLVHAFEKSNNYQAQPLTRDRVPHAIEILETWKASTKDQADYAPSLDALHHADAFGLHGRVYYVEGKPAGYTLGEPLGDGSTFVVHYEKAVPNVKGLYQLINMEFARSLPGSILLMNREQDLGDPGLRQAKLTYRPSGFIKKYRVRRPALGA